MISFNIKQKTGWLVLLLLLLNHSAMAQTNDKLTLEECYQLAKINYPAIQKLDLVAKTSDLEVQNASKRFLPQLSFSGQATYQSQAISFANALASLPMGASLPSVSKDQYKIQGEINQLLYDGGITHSQKELIKANSALQAQNIEGVLYAIKHRINGLFFSILLIEAQLKQNELNKVSLATQIQKTEAALANGIAFRSNVDELKAEILNLEMIHTDYQSNRTAYLQMLSLFIGKTLPANIQLVLNETDLAETTLNRPEIKAFELQKSIFDKQEKQLKVDYLPQINAFFQSAYGRPTLNIIENKFGPWYITGIRFNWSLGSLYTSKNKKRILNLNRQVVDADKEIFLLNTKIDLTLQEEQILKYQSLLNQDEKAIALRQSVTRSAEAQLANGVITTHEYIQKINAEHLARQSLILHQIQLLQAKYNKKYLSGN